MSSDQSSIGVSLQDATMSLVSKDFFFDGMVLPVTIYLKIKKDHYLLIGKPGEKCSFSNLHSYQNKSSMTYVQAQDRLTLVNYVTQLTEKVMQQKTMPPAVKTKFLLGLTQNALSSFDGKGFTSIAELQRVSQMVTDLGKTVSSFDEVISILQGLKDEEAKHSMSTCLVSVMLCEEMQINLKGAIEKVSLGALLHDIGLRHLPPELLQKPKHLWTHEDNALYETHPAKGVEMLRDLKEISNEVLLIIMEHHENAIGTGFPRKIRDVKISPLGRIVIVASYFTSLIFSRMGDGNVYNAEQAIVYINDILGQPFNKQVFSALKNIVNKAELKAKMNAS